MGVGASLLVMTLINAIMYMAGSLKALIVFAEAIRVEFVYYINIPVMIHTKLQNLTHPSIEVFSDPRVGG